MKQRYSLIFFCIVPLLIVFCSCQKNLGTKDKESDLRGTPLPGQQTYCRIESLWENPRTPEERYRLVLYDEYENPVAITSPVLGTGDAYRTFRYDQWHRLTDYIGHMNGVQFNFWHRFGYDQSGRIAYDTTFYFGLLGERPTDYWFFDASKIEYDSQNRISKSIAEDKIGDTYITNYTYDAAGNLIHPASDGVVYDNKINVNRTNDIWMFLSRDYSVNNPFSADSYNAAGYPTKISAVKKAWMMSEMILSPSEISYGCRQAYW